MYMPTFHKYYPLPRICKADAESTICFFKFSDSTLRDYAQTRGSSNANHCTHTCSSSRPCPKPSTTRCAKFRLRKRTSSPRLRA